MIRRLEELLRQLASAAHSILFIVSNPLGITDELEALRKIVSVMKSGHPSGCFSYDMTKYVVFGVTRATREHTFQVAQSLGIELSRIFPLNTADTLLDSTDNEHPVPAKLHVPIFEALQVSACRYYTDTVRGTRNASNAQWWHSLALLTLCSVLLVPLLILLCACIIGCIILYLGQCVRRFK